MLQFLAPGRDGSGSHLAADRAEAQRVNRVRGNKLEANLVSHELFLDSLQLMVVRFCAECRILAEQYNAGTSFGLRIGEYNSNDSSTLSVGVDVELVVLCLA